MCLYKFDTYHVRQPLQGVWVRFWPRVRGLDEDRVSKATDPWPSAQGPIPF